MGISSNSAGGSTAMFSRRASLVRRQSRIPGIGMFGRNGLGSGSTQRGVDAAHNPPLVMTFNVKARALILIGLTLASLNACGGTAKPGATTQIEPAPIVGARDSTDQKQAALTPARPTAPEAARRKLVPLDQMRGLTAAQITAMLGKPQFLRQDDTTELWQYRGESCVLHLFLYRANDEWRVRHVEVRPRAVSGETLKGEAAESCLAKLAAAPPAATS